MTVAAKTTPTTLAAAPTPAGTPQNPPTGYTPPAATTLGTLEQVQAGNGYYYDGPRTTYLRYS